MDKGYADTVRLLLIVAPEVWAKRVEPAVPRSLNGFPVLA
jgi:hypothetical protein